MLKVAAVVNIVPVDEQNTKKQSGSIHLSGLSPDDIPMNVGVFENLYDDDISMEEADSGEEEQVDDGAQNNAATKDVRDDESGSEDVLLQKKRPRWEDDEDSPKVIEKTEVPFPPFFYLSHSLDKIC